jgi:hypothetical protein
MADGQPACQPTSRFPASAKPSRKSSTRACYRGPDSTSAAWSADLGQWAGDSRLTQHPLVGRLMGLNASPGIGPPRRSPGHCLVASAVFALGADDREVMTGRRYGAHHCSRPQPAASSALPACRLAHRSHPRPNEAACDERPFRGTQNVGPSPHDSRRSWR